jgi:hypothetical protein
MPCPSRKNTRKTYFRHRNHRQKGVEKRWKDKYVELERRFEVFLENAACYLVWDFLIIIIFIFMFVAILINKYL